MPNWCVNYITFHGEANEIKQFHKQIEEWTSENQLENGFGPTWLGNIVAGAGLGDRINSDTDRIRCRGWVDYGPDDIISNECDSCFSVYTQTAWAPMISMWYEVIKHLGYKSIGLSYLAEEPNMWLYEKYDPYGDHPEKYYMDYILYGEDEKNGTLKKLEAMSRYYEDEDKLRFDLQYFLQEPEPDLDILISKFNEYPLKNEESWTHIHEYIELSNPEGADQE